MSDSFGAVSASIFLRKTFELNVAGSELSESRPHSHVPVCAAPSGCGLWLPRRPMPGLTEEEYPAGLWSDPAEAESSEQS